MMETTVIVYGYTNYIFHDEQWITITVTVNNDNG